jgi:hypothetical protein
MKHTFNSSGTPFCPVERVPVFIDDDGSCSACGAILITWHCSNGRPDCGHGHPCDPMTCNWERDE